MTQGYLRPVVIIPKNHKSHKKNDSEERYEMFRFQSWVEIRFSSNLFLW